jgi:hypothetical protein
MTAVWPAFVVATVNGVTLVDNDNTKLLHCGQGLYYGISWDENSIYLLGRSGARSVGHPDILTINKDYSVSRKVIDGSFLDAHQIYCDGPNLYVTSTRLNCVEVVNLSTGRSVEKNWTKYKVDINHINSIFKDGNEFWVTYHNWTSKSGLPSEIVRVDCGLSKELEKHIIEDSGCLHNVVKIDNLIYTCSSSSHALLVYDLNTNSVVKKVKLGYWLRGIGISDDYVVLGSTSVSGNRKGRLTGDSEVYLLDRKTLDIIDIKTLKDTGSIYDLRLAGCKDYAHNNIDYPGVL